MRLIGLFPDRAALGDPRDKPRSVGLRARARAAFLLTEGSAIRKRTTQVLRKDRCGRIPDELRWRPEMLGEPPLLRSAVRTRARRCFQRARDRIEPVRRGQPNLRPGPVRPPCHQSRRPRGGRLDAIQTAKRLRRSPRLGAGRRAAHSSAFALGKVRRTIWRLRPLGPLRHLGPP